MIESLESRFLLSITLRGGTLEIVGTDGNDRIQLSHPNSNSLITNPSRTVVDFNGKRFNFKTIDIKRIFIDGRAGDDLVQIGLSASFNVCGAFRPPDLYPFQPSVPTLLIGGSGSDTLIGGSGKDRMYGGPGSDELYGGANVDQLRGGAGDDILTGGSGHDRLFGQAGNDFLDGNRIAWDRPESDQMVGGADNDTLFSDSSDQISGGPGDDLLQYPATETPINGIPLPPSFDVPSDIERTESYSTGACY